MLIIKQTERGFARADFTDRDGAECSIQKSEEACIWLGVNNNRMHLTRELTAELLLYLQRFVETGELEQQFAGVGAPNDSKPEITTDGRTVWVNGPMCLGRFSPRSSEAVMADLKNLKYRAPPDWETWRADMLEQQAIVVSDEYKPGWCE